MDIKKQLDEFEKQLDEYGEMRDRILELLFPVNAALAEIILAEVFFQVACLNSQHKKLTPEQTQERVNSLFADYLYINYGVGEPSSELMKLSPTTIN